MHISVIGLGKLGLCTAACFAAAGHTVYGYDQNTDFRNDLRARNCPINETGLPELLDKAWSSLVIVNSCAEAVLSSQATLIIVPTPSQPDGRFSNDFVIKVLEEMAPSMADKDSFHVVDVVSTVMPGSSDNIFTPLLEKLTGKRSGVGFGLVYNPEFIALGSVIQNFLNPDMVLIGASDDFSSKLMTELYQSTCNSNPTISVMSLINAEITKISLNCYVTMKISYANALAALCEKVQGADIDVITSAIGADSRVGKKYLKGGLGFGGPCFPRDNIAFQSFAEEFGTDALLGKAVVAINNSIPNRLQEQINALCQPPARVALLGLSYKADTYIVEESQSLMLASSLSSSGYSLALHDPKALESARLSLGSGFDYCADPYEAVDAADVIVMLTDWPEYRTLDWSRIFAAANTNAIVIDSWRTAAGSEMTGLRHLPLGKGNSAKESTRP